MKKKIFFGVLGGLFAIFTILSVNTSLNNNGDISLKNIAIMAQANADVNPECPNGCYANGNGCYCFIVYPCLKEAS